MTDLARKVESLTSKLSPFSIPKFFTPNSISPSLSLFNALSRSSDSTQLASSSSSSVKGQFMAQMIDEFTASDYKDTESHCIRYSKDGSNRYRQGQVSEFEWVYYCPAVFRKLQEMDNLDCDEYMMNVCDQTTLREVCAPRKPGAVVVRGDEERLVIKTVRKSELKVLLDMLPKYYEHVKKHGSNSLIVKLFGLHVVKPMGSYKIYFIVLANVVQSHLQLHRVYDLKGSLQGRAISKEVVNEKAILKDTDLDCVFQLEPSVHSQLLEQLKHDCEFLVSAGVMDYSLLLGLHIEGSDQASIDMRSAGDQSNSSSNTPEVDSSLSTSSSYGHQEGESRMSTSNSCGHLGSPVPRFGSHLPAKAVPIARDETGNLSSNRRVEPQEAQKVFLHFGIVDIFQSYNMVKRLEHCYKSFHYDSKSITAVSASVYSSRFQDFLSKVFVLEDSDVGSELPSSPVSS